MRLPISPSRQERNVRFEARGGIEPPYTGFADPRITTLLPRQPTDSEKKAILYHSSLIKDKK
jgi:hypothetical protein